MQDHGVDLIRPTIHRVFEIKEAGTAHAVLKSGPYCGKIVRRGVAH
ncbi:MAG: hypothetical protein PHX82_01570 [Paracoccaceae bacterium]|nr:hypothetical protein [Paracoccaceae bacterium]